MARIRSIHPEQWTDEDFCSLSPMARLLAIGIRNFADDNGVFPCKAFTLKANIFPADNCDVQPLLDELSAANIYLTFDDGGATFGLIRNFHRFQRPDKPTYKYPMPTQELPEGYATRRRAVVEKSESSRRVVGEQSESSRRVVADPSGTEKEMEKEKEKETYKEKENTTTGGDTEKTDIPQVQQQAVMEFACDGTKPIYVLTESEVARYAAAYPKLDIEAEARMAKAWLESNPDRRKTYTGMPRFLNNWFSKATNNARAAPGGRGIARPEQIATPSRGGGF